MATAPTLTAPDKLEAIASKAAARLDAAIQLGTIHGPRLRKLRGYLTAHRSAGNPVSLDRFLAEYGDAIDGECFWAERAHARSPYGMPGVGA